MKNKQLLYNAGARFFVFVAGLLFFAGVGEVVASFIQWQPLALGFSEWSKEARLFFVCVVFCWGFYCWKAEG